MGKSFDVGVLYPSEWLKAEDLKGKPRTVLIDRIYSEQVEMQGGRSDECVIATFKGKRKKWIIGKTNGYALGVLFGRDLRHAVGKQVTLTPDKDKLRGVEVPCVRVLGSPDAEEDRAAAYERAWRGERMRGKLVGRLKLALAAFTEMEVPPVEPEPEEPVEETPDPSEAFDDDFDDEDEPRTREPGEE